MLMANEVTDDDLIGMLSSRLWLARGGSVALGLPGALRKALCQAHQFSAEGGSPTSIVKMPRRSSVFLPTRSIGSGTEFGCPNVRNATGVRP